MESINFENTPSSINSSAFNNTAADSPNDELTQSDFIELLVAQVKNQDPTKPMDPSQFMTQLTQSSMVNGINDLNKSFDGLSTKLTSNQSLQAAGLVGRSVSLPGGQGLLETGGSIKGEINLEGNASSITLSIYNTSGEQVRTIPLGNGSGNKQFKWDGFAGDGSVASAGHYLVTAEATINGKQQAVEVSLENRIDSISISNNGSGTGTLLNLSSGQSVSLNDVTNIK